MFGVKIASYRMAKEPPNGFRTQPSFAVDRHCQHRVQIFHDVLNDKSRSWCNAQQGCSPNEVPTYFGFRNMEPWTPAVHLHFGMGIGKGNRVEVWVLHSELLDILLLFVEPSCSWWLNIPIFLYVIDWLRQLYRYYLVNMEAIWHTHLYTIRPATIVGT